MLSINVIIAIGCLLVTISTRSSSQSVDFSPDEKVQDCTWAEWRIWGPCSKTCGGGERSRRRIKYQPALGGGRDCDDAYTQTERCNTQNCPGCTSNNDCPVSTEVCKDNRCHRCDEVCGQFASCRRDGLNRYQCFCPPESHGDPTVACLIGAPGRLAEHVTTTYQSINDLGQNLLAQVWLDRDNVVFSPLSLHVALAMLTSGATESSKTQRELLDVLERSENIQGLESYYHGIFQDQKTDKVNDEDFPLTIGNKIWTSERYFPSISASYVETTSRNYDADVEPLPKQSTAAANRINQWVDKTTRGRITKLVDSVGADIQLMLTNAVHFKDSWEFAFLQLGPESRNFSFQLENGQELDGLKMMLRSSRTFTLTTPFVFEDILPSVEFMAASIPYQYDGGKRFDMVIVMPTEDPKGLLKLGSSLKRKQDSHDNIMDKIFLELDIANQRASQDGIRPEINLTLPPFNIRTDLDVVENLRKLGVNAAFDEGGFAKMTGGRPGNSLRVDSIKHKAVIEVTPEGTDAAAATSIEVVPLFGSFEQPKNMFVNKPFLFAIRDIAHKSIVFTGKVSRPEQSSRPAFGK